MDNLTFAVIFVALAMDAFAVALTAGLTLPQLTSRHLFLFGFHFSLFHAMMPVFGWLAGMTLKKKLRRSITGLLLFYSFLLATRCSGDRLESSHSRSKRYGSQPWLLV